MHSFLQLAPVSIPINDARHIVKKSLRLVGLDEKTPLDWIYTVIHVPLTPGPARFLKLRDLLEQTRNEGYPRSLYEVSDLKDPFFGGRFLMATDSSVIHVGTRVGSFAKELPGPCRSAPLENDLTEDILHFRKAACETSGSTGFYDCCRNYRSYLQSSVSLIDCFLNRYVELLRLSDPRKEIAFARGPRLEDRLDAWAIEFAPDRLASFKESTGRAKFAQVRKARNDFVHAREPYIGVSLPSLPDDLNAVRKGVGGLLLKMRELAGQPTLGFIEKLRAAPPVVFHPKPDQPDALQQEVPTA